MSKKKYAICGICGIVIAYAALWGGSWIMHIVPDYLGVASFATMFSGVIIGIATAAYGWINFTEGK